MSQVSQLIDELRSRSDLDICDEPGAWRIAITKGRDYICEVTVPRDVLEWFASVKRRGQEKEQWCDWMDYCGYDNTPTQKLEAEMAKDIKSFVDRVSMGELCLPLEIHERET